MAASLTISLSTVRIIRESIGAVGSEAEESPLLKSVIRKRLVKKAKIVCVL
jgi:hypothetical protein